MRPTPKRLQRGISLIISMLMLAVIGLAAAAIMRNAISTDRITLGMRLQVQATQFAQVALRFCESELLLPPEARVVAVVGGPPDPPAWSLRASWLDRAGATAAHVLSEAELASAVVPRAAPACLAETTADPAVFTITARGFSPDFTPDAASGRAATGAVVWLQSSVLLPPACAGASCPAPSIRQRAWRQLLTPPF